MPNQQRNSIEFKVSGRQALFTDPLSRVGGEKCSYHLPTYEALKGVAKSIYWKPTIIWVIDEVRVMKRIQTQSKGIKPLKMSGGNDLSIYTYLRDVEYQVRAHFEWNMQREALASDRNEHKHHNIAKRMVERGGRQDIFLGTRECQSYVEPCSFGEGEGELDDAGELDYGLMFHGFDYPDEVGGNAFNARFWRPKLVNGRMNFIKPADCDIRKFIRNMSVKEFSADNLKSVEAEFTDQETS